MKKTAKAPAGQADIRLDPIVRAEIVKEFNAVVNRQYRNFMRRKSNRGLKARSMTIRDPIQFKLAVMAACESANAETTSGVESKKIANGCWHHRKVRLCGY